MTYPIWSIFPSSGDRKMLKAFVCRDTREIPPKIHNLLNLGDKTNLLLDQSQKDFCAILNSYQISGRYPDMLDPEPSIEIALTHLKKVKELFNWLKNLLKIALKLT